MFHSKVAGFGCVTTQEEWWFQIHTISYINMKVM